MLQAADAFPMNLGFLGKGNASRPEALRQQITAGAIGLQSLDTLWRIVGGRITDAELVAMLKELRDDYPDTSFRRRIDALIAKNGVSA